MGKGEQHRAFRMALGGFTLVLGNTLGLAFGKPGTGHCSCLEQKLNPPTQKEVSRQDFPWRIGDEYIKSHLTLRVPHM